MGHPPAPSGDIEALRAWTLSNAQREEGSGEPLFLGIPDRWYEDIHFRCPNGHVSTRVLRCEDDPRDRCLACGEPTVMTFPEDEGPLRHESLPHEFLTEGGVQIHRWLRIWGHDVL